EGGREMSQPFYRQRVGGLSCDEVGPGVTPQKVTCTGDSGTIFINDAPASNIAACGTVHSNGVRSVCTEVDDGLGVIEGRCNGMQCPPEIEYYLTIDPSPGALRVGEVLPLEVTAWERLWVHDISEEAGLTVTTADPTIVSVDGHSVKGEKVGVVVITVNWTSE